MRAAWFLGRSVWRRRWVGLVGLGLLAGVVAGVVVGAVGGIRRSSTSFERLIDQSRIAPYSVVSLGLTELPVDYGDALRARPEIRAATSTRQFIGREDREKNWWSVTSFGNGDPTRPTMVEGRPPADDRADEVIVSVNTARLFDLDVGGDLLVDFYTNEQMQRIDEDSWTPPGGPSPLLEVVGIYREPLDAARSGTGTSVRASAAFATAYGIDAGISGFQIALEPGFDGADLRAAVDAVNQDLGLAGTPEAPTVRRWLDLATRAEQQSQSVVRAGLGAFAFVAAVAGLVAFGQALRRWCSPIEADQAPLSAMGATGADRRIVVTIAALPYLIVAVPVAAAVAYATSAIFPIGVIRDLEPEPGLLLDAPLLVLGSAVVAATGVALTWSVATAVVRRRESRRRAGAVRGLGAAEVAGLPVPATVGMRFAVRPGSAHRALPVNTAIAAAVLAVAGVTAAMLFTGSLDRLVETPERYGNAWDLSLELLSSPDGDAALDELVADPDIAAIDAPTTLYAPISVGGVETQATVLRTVKGTMQLQLQRGRSPSGPQEIVVGPKLLAETGAELGGEIEVVGLGREPVDFTIVGTALSVLNGTDTYQSEAFFGPDVDPSVVPESLEGLAFEMVQVRFEDGVDTAAATRRIDDAYPFALMNESVPSPPAEVVNVAQLDRLPRLLAAFFAALGFAALVHALAVTVRSRRRDLGILRSLGFTRRQSASTIVAMTSTIVLIGIVVGVPLGVLVGASTWRLVAQNVYVATDSVLPLVWIGLAAVVALAGANIVALVPARAAARQSPVEALRSE